MDLTCLNSHFCCVPLVGLSTYIWEMTGKFTVGTADVEAQWDEYVENVKKLEVEKILAVKQAQYDRLESQQ